MIKRKLAYLFFIIFTLTGTDTGMLGQSTFRHEWAIGGSAGVDFPSVSFRPRVLKKTLIGFNGGITARWITEKNLGLQLEVNFTQKGWKEDLALMDEDGVLSMSNPFYIRKMNYIDIPFFTHIYFGNEKVRFFVNLGPQVGFFVSETTSQNLNGETIPYHPNEQHSMPVEKIFEWGIGGGPGMEFRSGIGYFLLEGRYYYALSDFYNTRRGDAFSKASTQVIAVKLTYLIPLGK